MRAIDTSISIYTLHEYMWSRYLVPSRTSDAKIPIVFFPRFPSQSNNSPRTNDLVILDDFVDEFLRSSGRIDSSASLYYVASLVTAPRRRSFSMARWEAEFSATENALCSRNERWAQCLRTLFHRRRRRCGATLLLHLLFVRTKEGRKSEYRRRGDSTVAETRRMPEHRLRMRDSSARMTRTVARHVCVCVCVQQ